MHITEQLDTPASAERLRLHTRPMIWIAEDDDDIRETLTALFAFDGFVVRAAMDGARMFQWLFCEHRHGARKPDVIITDHRMPGYCALDILESLGKRMWTIPVIVITAYGSEVQGLARLHGARAVFHKPFEPDDLRMATMHCINWNTRSLPPRKRPPGPPEYEVVSRARRALRSEIEHLPRTDDA